MEKAPYLISPPRELALPQQDGLDWWRFSWGLAPGASRALSIPKLWILGQELYSFHATSVLLSSVPLLYWKLVLPHQKGFWPSAHMNRQLRNTHAELPRVHTYRTLGLVILGDTTRSLTLMMVSLNMIIMANPQCHKEKTKTIVAEPTLQLWVYIPKNKRHSVWTETQIICS